MRGIKAKKLRKFVEYDKKSTGYYKEAGSGGTALVPNSSRAAYQALKELSDKDLTELLVSVEEENE